MRYADADLSDNASRSRKRHQLPPTIEGGAGYIAEHGNESMRLWALIHD
jgi:hypothetical protein